MKMGLVARRIRTYNQQYRVDALTVSYRPPVQVSAHASQPCQILPGNTRKNSSSEEAYLRPVIRSSANQFPTAGIFY